MNLVPAGLDAADMSSVRFQSSKRCGDMKLLINGGPAVTKRLEESWPDHFACMVAPHTGSFTNSALRTGLPWASDNGAFKGFDPEKFRAFLDVIAGKPHCLFAAVPDVVADARATLDRFWMWHRIMFGMGLRLAFVGQDGIESLSVPWPSFDCWFVGGSTEWKLSDASADLMAEAKQRGKWVHVGRVNSLARMTWAYDHGADSIDGSNISGKWGPKYLQRHIRWLRRLKVQSRLEMTR